MRRDWDAAREAEVQEMCKILVERGRLIFQGVQALRLLRGALDRAEQRAGIVVEWDPSSSVDLMEWFGVTSLSAMRWAIAGGAAGLLLCGMTNRASWGTVVGAGLGAVLGAIQGHQAVRSGWRLRSYVDAQGTVCVEVKALPASAG